MTKSVVKSIYSKLYQRDVDKTMNIFLCGADTGKTDSFRNLLNIEFKKHTRFNVVYPEFIFATLLNKKDSNLLELEDELAKYVDLIIIPLEFAAQLITAVWQNGGFSAKLNIQFSKEH